MPKIASWPASYAPSLALAVAVAVAEDANANANANANADLVVITAAYHRLLLHYLHVERRSCEEECDDRIGITGGGGGHGSSCSSRRCPRLASLAVDFDGKEDSDCNPTTRGGQTSLEDCVGAPSS